MAIVGVMNPDRRIAAWARRQHGVFTRSQALESGLSEHAVTHRLQRGLWVALTPGVYTVAAMPVTWERQLTAALLSRPGSVACAESAALLHRMPGFEPGPPVILTPADSNARLKIGRVVRVTDFDEVATTSIRGFPTTSVAETLWMLARSMRDLPFSNLVEQQVSMGRTSTSELYVVLDRVAGTRVAGLRRFRQVVARIDPSTEGTASNLLESALYRLLSSYGVPKVDRQRPFLLAHPARVDAYIPSWRMVVEADGRTWHTRQSDFQADRDRDNAFAQLGIVVIRFTYQDLTRRFQTCLETLLAAGHHRRAMNTA